MTNDRKRRKALKGKGTLLAVAAALLLGAWAYFGERGPVVEPGESPPAQPPQGSSGTQGPTAPNTRSVGTPTDLSLPIEDVAHRCLPAEARLAIMLGMTNISPTISPALLALRDRPDVLGHAQTLDWRFFFASKAEFENTFRAVQDRHDRAAQTPSPPAANDAALSRTISSTQSRDATAPSSR